jgi:uridine kinase
MNALLTEGIDDAMKFKIYISPFTPISIDHHNRVSTTDARMLRRIVRDYKFRASEAQRTIDMWPDVRKSEDVNIFPYNSEADVFFNSNCIYELAVLKKYAEPLLKRIKRDEPEYAEARRMLNFLKYFDSIYDDSMIPNNSIMREFIGGSVLLK